MMGSAQPWAIVVDLRVQLRRRGIDTDKIPIDQWDTIQDHWYEVFDAPGKGIQLFSDRLATDLEVYKR